MIQIPAQASVFVISVEPDLLLNRIGSLQEFRTARPVLLHITAAASKVGSPRSRITTGQEAEPMLEDIFETPFSRNRHRSTLFAPHLDEYIDDLTRCGYGDKMVRRNIFLITSFGEFLSRRKVDTVDNISLAEVNHFVKIGRSREGPEGVKQDETVGC